MAETPSICSLPCGPQLAVCEPATEQDFNEAQRPSVLPGFVALGGRRCAVAGIVGGWRVVQLRFGRGHLAAIVGDGGSGILRFAQSMARFAPAASDTGHVFAIAANGFAALSPGAPGFFGRELVGCALGMSGTSAAARYFALLALVHGGKAACARSDRWLSGRGHLDLPLGRSLRDIGRQCRRGRVVE